MLAPEELLQYSRQIKLPEVGRAGQLRLQGAAVSLWNLGAGGSMAAVYLCTAGLGHLLLLDDRAVAADDIAENPWFTKSALGRPRNGVLAETLRALNPQIRTDCPLDFTDQALLPASSWCLDYFENAERSRQAARLCLKSGAGHLVAGNLSQGAFLMGLARDPGPCFFCAFPANPGLAPAPRTPSLPPLALGPWLALEAIKLILNLGATVEGRLTLIQPQPLESTAVALKRNPHCKECGQPVPAAL